MGDSLFVRILRLGVAASMIPVATGCAASRDTGGGEGGCVFGVRWHGISYTSPQYRVDQLASASVITPEKGSYVGVGREPKCGEGGGGHGTTPVRLYRVPGVSTAIAVVSSQRQLAIANGEPIPDFLLSPSR
jgi:hypothetical protein